MNEQALTRSGGVRKRIVGALAAIGIAASGLTFAAASPALAAGELSIQKSVVLPTGVTKPAISNVAGTPSADTFVYTLSYSCTTFDPGGCTDVVVTDELPANLEFVGPLPSGWTLTGQSLTIPVGNIAGGAGTTVQFNVRFRVNTALVAYDPDLASNTATINGKVAGTEIGSTSSNTVNVTGEVKPTGGALAAKGLNPTSVHEFGDGTVTATVSGTNNGNLPATSIVVTDQNADFFDAFDVTSIPAPVLPAGATSATVEIFDGTTWTTVATPFTAATPGTPWIQGVRVTYTGTAIPPATTASLPFDTVLRDTLHSSGAQVVVGNQATYVNSAVASVTYDDATLNKTSTTTTATQTVIGEELNQPTLTKVNSPTTISVGTTDPITTTLTGTLNGATAGTTVGEITILDPAPGGTTPFGSALLMDTVSLSTFPTGATSASLALVCPPAPGTVGATTSTITAAGAFDLTGLDCTPDQALGFEITVTGTNMPASNSAVATVTSHLNSSYTIPGGGSNTTLTNTATIAAVSSTGQAVQTSAISNAPLVIQEPTGSVEVAKSFTRSNLLLPGSGTTSVSLPSTYTGNVPATQMIIQDPQVLPTAGNGTDFFDQFDITQVRSLACAQGDSVAIQIYNGSAWVPISTGSPVTYPCVAGLPLVLSAGDQAIAQGIRFIYTNTAGIQPGSTRTPLFGIKYRATLRDTGAATPMPAVDDPIDTPENCAEASVFLGGSQTPTATDATDAPCPSVRLIALAPGLGIDKVIDGPSLTDPSGIEGSHQQMIGTFSISKLTFPAERLIIQDPNPGDTTFNGLAVGVFSAVTDLVQVGSPTAGGPGSITVPMYERARIELLSGATWNAATNSWVGGTWTDATGWLTGGQNLYAAGDPSVQSWRMTFEENPADPGLDPGLDEADFTVVNPTTGAVTYQPVFQATYALRDTFRDAIGPHAAGDPVVNNLCYGTGTVLVDGDDPGPASSCEIFGFLPNGGGDSASDAGWILNNVQARLENVTMPDGEVTDLTSIAGTEIDQVFHILNGSVHVEAAKSVDPNTPIPLPADGAAPGALQERTVRLQATNTSDGVQVNELRIRDLEPVFWNNFELRSVTTSNAGATPTFDVTFAGGAPAQNGLSLAALNALANLADVNGLTAHFVAPLNGGIAVGDSVQVDMVVRLRAATLDGNVPIVSPSTYQDNITADAYDIVSSELDSPASTTLSTRDGNESVVTNKEIDLAPGSTDAIDLGPVLNVAVRTTNDGEIPLPAMRTEDDDAVDPADYPASFTPPTNVDGDFWAITDFQSVTSIVAPVNAETIAVSYWDGTTWVVAVTGMNAAAIDLAAINAAIPAANVEGIRVDYTSTSGADIQPGAVGSLGFAVKVRSDATPDVAVVNCAESALPSLQPGVWTYDGPACAQYTPRLGTLGVDVAKVFVPDNTTLRVGAAGTTQTYDMTITNTGQQNIGIRAGSSPFTIIDTIGPNLTYNFGAITATVPTAAGHLSTLTSAPTPVFSGASAGNETLTWTWPAGEYLAPGEVVTIQVTVDVDPALVASTQGINTIGVPMPAQPDCVPLTGTTADTYADGQCQASATFQVNNQGAIRAVKAILGEGYNVPAAPGSTTLCPPRGDFVAAPCVATTPSGSTYTWRLSLQNSGNSELSNLVVIDRLPAVADTGAALDQNRGSEWRGTPSTAPVIAGLPAGVTATIQVLPGSSTELTKCLQEVGLAAGTTCGDWVALAAGSVIPADAQAIRVFADFGVNSNPLMAPGDTVTISWDEIAPAALVGTTDGYNSLGATIADGRLEEWNSFGYRANEPATSQTYRNESNKAGALFDARNLTISKVVDEGTVLDPADFGKFTVNYDCVFDSVHYTGTVEVADAETAIVTGLPTGTVCTLTEDASNDFEWSGPSGNVVNGAYVVTLADTTPETVAVILTNSIDGAELFVQKHVVGTPPTGVTSYDFTVRCTFDGQPITVDAGDEAFTLTDSEMRTIGNLPPGASCTVTETTTGQADRTTIVVAGIALADPATSTEVTEIEGGELVEVTNTYLATLSVTKTLVNGSILPDSAFGPFPITVTCGTETVLGTVDAGETWDWTGGEILAGTVCTVTETDLGGATSATINGESTMTLELDPLPQGSTDVDLTNTVEVGALNVAKSVLGTAIPAGYAFGFSAECSYLDAAIALDAADAAFTITASDTHTISDLPVGAECTLTETDSGNATGTTVSVDGGAPVDGLAVTVTIPAATQADPAIEVVYANSFVAAGLTLRKLVQDVTGSTMFIEADDTDGLTGQFVKGDAVTWHIVVTNNGAYTLRDLVVDDPLTPACNSTIAVLAPGESVTISCTSTELAAKVNTATVTDPDTGLTATDTARIEVRDATVQPPPPPTTVPEPPTTTSTLPKTGGSVGGTITLAFFLLAGGALVVLVTKRRRAKA